MLPKTVAHTNVFSSKYLTFINNYSTREVADSVRKLTWLTLYDAYRKGV